MSTQAATPETPDHHAKAVASGSLQLPRLGPDPVCGLAGGGMTPMTRGGPAVRQTSHDPLCQMLRKVLVDGAQAGRGAAGGIGSIPLRACAALYELLLEHPIDQWDRCRSCRRPGSVLGSRWRPCEVHAKATLFLRRLDEVLLLDLLAEE